MDPMIEPRLEQLAGHLLGVARVLRREGGNPAAEAAAGMMLNEALTELAAIGDAFRLRLHDAVRRAEKEGER